MAIRSWLLVSCISIFGCAAGQPPIADSPVPTSSPQASSLLRDASLLLLAQGKQEHFWTDRALLRIAEQQIRANDFEGALRSIQGSAYDYGRERALRDLAKALARNGQEERALKISRMMELSRDEAQWLYDEVSLEWSKHLIDIGDFQAAAAVTEQLKSSKQRCEGFQQLAVAHAKSNDPAQSARYFTRAMETVPAIKNDFDRAQALWEIGEAQRLAGLADAAHQTLERLAEMTDALTEPRTKVAAFRQCAVLAAKLGDKERARSLFQRAIQAQPAVDELNRLNALEQISIVQASVGFIQEAQHTALLIKHSEKDFTQDSNRERALYAIAVAQVSAGDARAAIATALSIEYFLQYRNDAVNAVVAHQIANQNLDAALASTKYFENPTCKATAMLKVAAAKAKSGDRKAAAAIAAQIKLTHRSKMRQSLSPDAAEFDYRRPQTWGARYDLDDVSTMTSSAISMERSAELAAAAMELAQALDYKPTQSFATLFNDVPEDVAESLARSHAIFGNPDEAMAWAKQIGGEGKIKEEDRDARWAVERRIHALLGVAEGMLDRAK